MFDDQKEAVSEQLGAQTVEILGSSQKETVFEELGTHAVAVLENTQKETVADELGAQTVTVLENQHTSSREAVDPVGASALGSLHLPHDLFPSETLIFEKAFAMQCGSKRVGSSQFGWLPGSGLVGERSLLQELNKVVDKISRRMVASFLWSTFRLDVNFAAGWHCDEVSGEVLVAVGGAFTGGELVIDKVGRFALKDKAMLFEGDSWHRVEAFSGRRWSLVAFLHPDLLEKDVSTSALKDFGFRAVPSHRPSLSLPRRVVVSRVLLADPRVVYIGRGCTRLGLGPSVWGNPFRAKGRKDVKKVVKAYKAHLSKSPGLLRELESLGGKLLACHCRAEEECHGDAIISEYKDRFAHDFCAVPPSQADALGHAADRLRQAGEECLTTPSRICGDGPPLLVGSGGRRRLLSDGGGLCSPGLWPPSTRAPVTALGETFCEALAGAVKESGVSAAQLLQVAAKEGILHSPFPEETVDRARQGIMRVLHEAGVVWPSCTQSQAQIMDFVLLGKMLRAVDDPDWEIMQDFEKGVRIGVSTAMPRTPAVYAEKTRWSLPGQKDASPEDLLEGAWFPNYASATDHLSEVTAVLEDQVARGQVLKLTEEEAVARYGGELQIAALGAVAKETRPDGSTAIRIVHDGTHGVGVNPAIKVMDQVTLPMADDIKTVLRSAAATGAHVFGLKADVMEAHRQIPVDPKDWPKQACQLVAGGEVYLNKVGTFGISSAPYWWSRAGAAVLRMAHAMFGGRRAMYLLLFSDDWLALACGKDYVNPFVLLLLFFSVVKMPISWGKVQVGQVLSWIGYEIDLKDFRLGISERRAVWLLGWYDRVLAAGVVALVELRQALGRMVYVYGALSWDRPFLAGLFSFLYVHPIYRTVSLPPFVRLTLAWLRRKLKERRSQPCAVRQHHLGQAFRVDAKADGCEVAVGGWLPAVGPDGHIDKLMSKWFAVTLTEETAPWAFHRGLPFKTISALELYGVTLGLMAFSLIAAPDGEVAKGSVQVTGMTDSRVASMVIGRGATSSFPLCLLAMEASAQMESRGLVLELEWVPREKNQEADDLSNLSFSGFDMSRRLQMDIPTLPFIVLPELQAASLEFFQHATRSTKRAEADRRLKQRKQESLSVREPW